jgi:hypothetical protein
MVTMRGLSCVFRRDPRPSGFGGGVRWSRSPPSGECCPTATIPAQTRRRRFAVRPNRQKNRGAASDCSGKRNTLARVAIGFIEASVKPSPKRRISAARGGALFRRGAEEPNHRHRALLRVRRDRGALARSGG